MKKEEIISIIETRNKVVSGLVLDSDNTIFFAYDKIAYEKNLEEYDTEMYETDLKVQEAIDICREYDLPFYDVNGDYIL